ncbi:MAG: hypothetical protein IH612_15765 [Desulfofustis sp.]|nr:hypothetical protein [Desulfofustis sp.]
MIRYWNNLFAAVRPLLARGPYLHSASVVHQENYSIITISLALFIAAFLLRSWQNVINPGLYWEDATHYFNLYYGLKRELSFILQHPNGYYNIINNLIAWIAAHLDVRLQPLSYHLFAMILGVITATNLLFSRLFQTRSILLAAPIVLGLSGMNHIYYYNTLTFQMYNVVVLLLCLLFYPTPRSKLSLCILCLIASLLVWSGPYSVVALPVSIFFLLFFRNGSKTILFTVVIINVVLYSLSVTESTVQIQNILDPSIRRIAAQVLFERVFFLDLLGKLTSLKLMLFCVLLGSAFFVLRRNAYYLKTSAILFAIILGGLAPLFLSIKFQLYQAVFPCHIYISIFFWLVFLLFTADRIMSHRGASVQIQVIVPLLFFSVVVIDNLRQPAKRYEKIMTSIPAFVETIHRVENLELEKDNTYVVIKTENVMPEFMPPMVRVGSQRPDARRLGRQEIELETGKEFIVE